MNGVDGAMLSILFFYSEIIIVILHWHMRLVPLQWDTVMQRLTAIANNVKDTVWDFYDMADAFP